MAKTFSQMVAAAMAEVPVVNPAEAHQRMQEDPRTLVIDPRDAADIPATGMVSGAMNISYGALTYKADNELPRNGANRNSKTALAPLLRLAKVGNWGPWLVNS